MVDCFGGGRGEELVGWMTCVKAEEVGGGSDFPGLAWGRFDSICARRLEASVSVDAVHPTGQWTRRWWWSLRRISDDSFLPSTIYHSRGPTIMTNRSSGSFPPALENGVIHWSISRVFCWRIDVTTCLFVYAYTYQLKYKFLILNLNWFWEVFIEVYFSVLFLDR